MDFEFHFIFDDISDLISVLFGESRFLYIPIAAIKAHKENTSLRDAAINTGYLSAEEFDKWVRPEDMIGD